jgi:hypothetical protein
MGRLIEVQDAQQCPSPLTVRTGDVLSFRAAGGCVRSGGDVVEMWGPFLRAALGNQGNLLTPTGGQNTVLVRAHGPGRATIEVVTGEPWHAPQTTILGITVEQ